VKLGRAPLLVLLCFAFARPSAAQDWKGQGRVEGKVTDTKGQPLEGVAIKLTLPGRGGTQVKTDKKGHWAIMGLAGGEWDIDYTVQGYQPKRISARFSDASSNSPVEVKLEKVPGPPAEVMAALDAGDAAYKAGNYAEARAQYEKLLTNETITSRPDVVRTLHMQIAHCYSQEKNIAKEMEHLQAVVDADPTNVDIKKLMALEALQGGMFEKGAEMLKALPESSMQDPDVLFNVGVAFYNNQKVDEAIDWWTRTLKANPSYADAYYWRANAYLSQNKLPEAKADYQKFIEVAPADNPQLPTVKKVLDQLK